MTDEELAQANEISQEGTVDYQKNISDNQEKDWENGTPRDDESINKSSGDERNVSDSENKNENNDQDNRNQRDNKSVPQKDLDFQEDLPCLTSRSNDINDNSDDDNDDNSDDDSNDEEEATIMRLKDPRFKKKIKEKDSRSTTKKATTRR